ncbi:MAG: phosphoribosylamine--glycine ligase [Clostridia bacterium]|nr:phosphoribosylamine--glycine ligase [Clostridia bacterium]
MKVLIVGGGGREHAIAASLLRDSRVTELVCAPGNGGIAKIARCVPVKATDIEGQVKLALEEKPDLVVVAPDDPLAMGLVDRLEENGIRAFGPRANAAEIEASKSFAKRLMEKYGIPTARCGVFDDAESAKAYVLEKGAPIVVKADGLALGKGVTVAATVEEALEAIESAFGGAFGAAGSRVVIEECLFGPEVSMLVFTDGKTIKTMVPSQDHKRVFDGDKGPNTGGMGAVSPVPCYTEEIHARCIKEIFEPTVKAMNAEGRPFKGVLYCGLMLTEKGPKVIEYNCRFGDPETQVVLPRLESSLLEIMLAITEDRLEEVEVLWDKGACVTVVLASGGYPGKYQTGFEIFGIEDAENCGGMVFHAGTKADGEKILTSGGRVLAVSAKADDLDSALASAYAAAGKIDFEGKHFRTDIGCHAR